MTGVSYDFRNPTPLAAELERRLGAWFGEVCRLAGKSWSRTLTFAAELQAPGHELMAPGEWLASVPEGTPGFRVELGIGSATSLLVFPRPLLLALLGGALGDAVTELPGDRELTSIEDGLCEFLLDTLFLSLLRESWPGTEPVALAFTRRELNLRSSRMFPPSDPILVATFRIVGPFGELDACWLLPRGAWMAALAPPPPKPRSVTPADPPEPDLAALAREMPVELGVVLGTAEVPLTQIAELQPGDVLVLSQLASDPLPATVHGLRKFRVWPGAAGTRRAIRIAAILKGDELEMPAN